jgi:TRAP-type C4-dicarboxylate transport system substrate-binding protein
MKFSRMALAAALIGCGLLAARAASAEDIKLRIASGHPVVQTYVNLMSTYFVPEVSKRVAARTKHKVEFIEAYGGSIVKVADVLKGVQSGIIDLGGYTETGFGAITWHALTMNKARFAKLPKEVQDIIVEVGREYEALTGKVNEEAYPKQLEQLRAHGVTVKKISDAARKDWANAMKDWPQQKADELDKQGLPGSQVLKLTLEEAEKLGHKWPVRYPIK